VTTAVLLHGAYGAPDDWDCVCEDLPVAASRPALDAQLAPEELDATDLDALGERLLDRLEERLPPGPLVLGGYSLGARLALALAQRPGVGGRLSGLLLVSGTGGLEAAKERAARAALDDERAEALTADPAAFLRAFWSLPLFAGLETHPRREELLAARVARASKDPARLSRLMRGLSVGRMAPLRGDLGRLTATTALVLCGANDIAYVQYGRRLAQSLPRARLAIVEDAGHALLLEAPMAVRRALDTLVRQPSRNR
jgi:2-succinyl-6-hydroxy-2,4-cyclohexadiene-1-carboxylate synthase